MAGISTRYWKWIVFLAALLLLLAVSVAISLSSGEIDITLGRLPQILSQPDSMEFTILTKIRIPRLILAIAVGGALSLSGAILQGIYRNPLVEPYTLGISGGAALGIAIAIVFGLNSLSFLTLPVFGFLGAIITLFLVYFLSIKRAGLSINSMLLIGVMVSFISSSAMMFLMSISTTDNLQSIVFWVMGSLDESNSMLIRIALYSSLAGLIITYFFAQPLNALRLGNAKAKHLGINTDVTVRLLFFCGVATDRNRRFGSRGNRLCGAGNSASGAFGHWQRLPGIAGGVVSGRRYFPGAERYHCEDDHCPQRVADWRNYRLCRWIGIYHCVESVTFSR